MISPECLRANSDKSSSSGKQPSNEDAGFFDVLRTLVGFACSVKN
jgi:hypothetical protein